MDVEYFPFDEQTCVMKFGSWTYDGFQVKMMIVVMMVKVALVMVLYGEPNGKSCLIAHRLKLGYGLMTQAIFRGRCAGGFITV